MGCGASVRRRTGNSEKPSTPANQRSKAQTQASEVPTFMASLQGHMPNHNLQGEEQSKMIHVIDLHNGSFPEKMPPRIECDDIVEFRITGKDEYDIFQVYKDGNDYYRVNNGYELWNIKNRTPENERRLLLSLALNRSEIDLYFCIIPSSQRETILATRKCPKNNCESNCLHIKKCEIKFPLTDEKESQKVYLHKGDTIEFEWVTKNGSSYRIEEKKYCPVSGGLYTIEQTADNQSNRSSAKGKFSKTFKEFGTSFLFRLTDTNQIHDITVCIINDTYKIKHIEITDNNIQPNLIWIEQTDWIIFEWNTKRKQTIIQIHPFTIDDNKQKSIELKTEGEHFFWPNEPTRCGFMCHQFNETGIFCYKNGTNQIGTIIVEPHKSICHVPIFGEQSIHKMNTKDLIQFDWKMTDSKEEPIFITIDSNSSVVPDAAGGVTGIFDCAIHKCSKVDSFFRHHFNTYETFLLNIPQHGLYNFAYTDNRDQNLISVIVENGIDNHTVVYKEDNTFEPQTLFIYRYDQVWFDSSSATSAGIYQTDEYGKRLDSEQALFRPQQNSINYFMKDFPQEGIYYFSTDINDDDKNKNQQKLTPPLAIIVLPKMSFHYQSIRKNDFDSHPIIANINDFIIWQFEQIISHNVIQIGSYETLQSIISSHERAVAGRNRKCLAVECIMPGTFYFANPAFEQATGSEQDRLISTIIIDPPFFQHCFVTTNRQFVPTVLHIAQNDTVSWIVSGDERNHQISVQSNDKEEEIDEENLIDRKIADSVHDVHHLHTFQQPGQYTIRSNRFQATATVFVHLESTIRSLKKRVQEPKIIEDIDILSPFGTQIHLTCPNRYANIYYTLDGSLPTRHFDNVHEYDPDTGVLLIEPGLHLIRAYSIEDQKLPSTVVTSSVTFVMPNKELEVINERRAVWDTSKITLSAAIQQPNKLYGNIDIEPTSSADIIDHFELYINDVALEKTIAAKDVQFSAEGFAGGEQYEIYVVAYPKENITDAEPISSNKLAFEIKREVHGGGPLITLSVSNDQNTLMLMWAHIGDHVSEYIIYVDNIETKIITGQDFNDFYGIQFHGAQQRKNYLFHVEAKIKNSNEIRKSNVIAISLPLEMPVKGPITDRHFPYITINGEATPADIRLETIRLNSYPNPHSEVTRKTETLPITNGFRNAIPTISYKRNATGITLLWHTKSPAIADSVENYRIIVDNQPYGKLISPSNEKKYHLNLLPGKHECYLEVIPKDENEEIFKSNVLKIDIPATSDLKHEQKQQKEPIDIPIHEVLEPKDIPIPKSTIQTINGSSIRANWYLDRPMPRDAFVALYEVHVRGQDFPDNMTSSEHFQQDGYIEHVWYASNSPLEITGISERQEYTIFIRALIHVQGITDIEYVITTSNEITTRRLNPLIDLLTRPLLKVTRVGLQMVNLSWTLDDSVDQALVKGYRIFLNSKPTEILPPNQHEYELRNLKPGTTNEIQVSVTSHRDFVDEKISEPISIVCPKRPSPPFIEAIQADNPFSIGIKWKIDTNQQDEISSFKIFLDGKLHGEIETNGRQSFKYDFNKLQPKQTYQIYIKAFIEHSKLDGNAYQCDIESNASNELSLKCAVPLAGTILKIERMHPIGIDLIWDAPVESGDVKLTGYQILKNGRAIGKLIPLDKRRVSINDLQIGNRYSFQVVPITNQPGGTLFRTGEEYDPVRHVHYLPGPKLEVEYTDLIQLPTKFWIENISGHSALVCWSPIDESSSSNVQPEGYKLFIWNNKEFTSEKPMTVLLTKDKTSVKLKDLQSGTTYEIQLEVYKKRLHQTTNDPYIVSTTSDIITFDTGSPPDPPANLYLIACTNTDARIGFDPFIEHNAEIITIRVQCEPISSEINTKEISLDLIPDSTEFILSNLIERTDYNVTIYGITEEYLTENRCRDISQLPKKFKPSDWLPNKTFQFKTSGCEPVDEINIRQATTESIKLDWTLPKVCGSTQYIGQILRWKLEHGGEERSLELDRNVTKAIIPGTLPSGLYKISLDSIFSIKINLEDDDDETSRKEIRLTTTKSTAVRFHAPATCEQPEIYLTGYTTNTIDFAWNKPNMFRIIDHPEKINEKLRIHRRLIGYRIDINGREHQVLDEDQYRCTLTKCQPDEKFEVQLIAQTIVQNEYINDMIINDKENDEQPDETPSKKLRVRMLKKQDLLRSFQTNFEFNHNESNENTIKQRNEIKPLGKLNVNWKVSDTKAISHFILQWRSSKDLRVYQKTIASDETSATIDSCDEKCDYVIEIILVTNDGERHQFEKLTFPIPGEPDPPELWLVKTSNTNFTVEWSEPKSYGLPIIGFQLYIEGKKALGITAVKSHHADIPSHINRTYHVNVCAITDNPQRSHSGKSKTLLVITTPETSLIPTISYNNDDGTSTSFDHSIARIIPLQIETINEETLHIDWTSFLSTPAIRAYYIHYTCLNNGEVQAMKVSKRYRKAVLRGLRPGFTYGIMVMAVDKNGGVLYTSDKSTVQMNAPPNAPIVVISERTNTHVKLEWRPAASYGEVAVVGYKIFVNNRLAAILTHDQLTYTLTNGIPCDIYTVHVQALSNEKNIISPMSRPVEFPWPGIKPGAFRRMDDGQTGTIVVAWEHPQMEDETEKIITYKLFVENLVTHAVRLQGEYDAATQQATIYDLNNGKYRLWLEIQSENYCVRARPITIMSGRFNSLLNRQTAMDSAKCFIKKQNRFRSPAAGITTPPLRHVQY